MPGSCRASLPPAAAWGRASKPSPPVRPSMPFRSAWSRRPMPCSPSPAAVPVRKPSTRYSSSSAWANKFRRPAENSSTSRSPARLAVPEKIFALFVCSIFSTATDSPPRFIRHRRRSAPNPHPPRPPSHQISPRLKGSPVQGELSAARLTEGLSAKGIISPRLLASRSLLQRRNLYGSPPGPYFSMKKSNQKSFRAAP